MIVSDVSREVGGIAAVLGSFILEFKAILILQCEMKLERGQTSIERVL